MITRSLCFETEVLCSPLHSAAPPNVIRDMSRNHRDAVFTDAPTWVQLPSGLWCTQYVSAQTNYCTITSPAELSGATGATILAWVRKDAYVQYQSVFSDYASVNDRIVQFGWESAENTFFVRFGNDATWGKTATVTNAFTVGWHFVWARYIASTSIECACDSSVNTNTTSIGATLGTPNNIYIGKHDTYYASQTLAALGIAARALTDEQIAIWREKYRPLIGV